MKRLGRRIGGVAYVELAKVQRRLRLALMALIVGRIVCGVGRRLIALIGALPVATVLPSMGRQGKPA
ncbi:MAG: hypothetical protein RKO66_11525 [Candidatus Contendobacter sp.]|nr:hypothetical protein [Candidatus Contendobacter sp.]